MVIMANIDNFLEIIDDIRKRTRLLHNLYFSINSPFVAQLEIIIKLGGKYCTKHY